MRMLDSHYIGGQWVRDHEERPRTIVNPATGEPSGHMRLGDAADVDRAVAAARAAFAAFSRTTRQDRLDLLDALIAEYQAAIDDMAARITEEMGAPAVFARKVQAPSGLGHLMTARKMLETFSFHEDRGSTRVAREPVGVVGMITPWNWPINQITCKVAPAIATGCTMVLKPSEVAPYSAELFAEIVDRAGVPAGVFNMIWGEGPTVGQAIAAHPDVDMVSITGSTRAGRAVQAAGADTIKRVTQELGGKSANILLDDLSDDAFVSAVTRDTLGVMMNTGQTCTARTRMFVPRDRMDRAAETAAAAAATVVTGAPGDAATQMGPISHRDQYEKVQSLIEKGMAEGARLVAGGPGRPQGAPNGGFFVQPTVFADVTPDMTIAREEIFGPVLSILPYDSEEEAVAMANDSPYGLAGAVTAADAGRARDVAQSLRTGIVHINGAPNDITAPFGGYKQSGNGREWGDYAFHDYLEVKAIMGFADDAGHAA